MTSVIDFFMTQPASLSKHIIFLQICPDMTAGFLLIASNIFSYANLIHRMVQESA